MFKYDASDSFRISGVPASLSEFKSSLTASYGGGADTIAISYRPDPAAMSEFNICTNVGASAPSDLSAAVGNFDSGTLAEDVRLTFTAPSFNAITSYNIQRATDTTGAVNACVTRGVPNDASNANFTTISTVMVFAGLQGTFIDFNRAIPSGNCYRIQTEDPITHLQNFSNQATAVITGASGDVTRPVSTSATLAFSSGFSNILDTGDRLAIVFSEQIAAANAFIRLTDSDCGAATNGGPFPCPAGGQTNTIVDIVCGTNASCALDFTQTTLTITMTANPSIVSFGSTAGAQFPAVITDSSGITDLSGNAWDLPDSPDRLITNP